eukprot:c19888_g1_i1.p1 GENE.c19888_g1_i1~~c19888_g1_i1.p1  ORF type:complete len:246 (+),score=50.41 c19888_g1_i1:563-1300(+)
MRELANWWTHVRAMPAPLSWRGVAEFVSSLPSSAILVNTLQQRSCIKCLEPSHAAQVQMVVDSIEAHPLFASVTQALHNDNNVVGSPSTNPSPHSGDNDNNNIDDHTATLRPAMHENDSTTSANNNTSQCCHALTECSGRHSPRDTSAGTAPSSCNSPIQVTTHHVATFLLLAATTQFPVRKLRGNQASGNSGNNTNTHGGSVSVCESEEGCSMCCLPDQAPTNALLQELHHARRVLDANTQLNG